MQAGLGEGLLRCELEESGGCCRREGDDGLRCDSERARRVARRIAASRLLRCGGRGFGGFRVSVGVCLMMEVWAWLVVGVALWAVICSFGDYGVIGIGRW